MTNQANTQAAAATTDELPGEQQVVDYLQQNPDFFYSHLELLNELKVPHPSGSAVSLVERQVSVLREKNRYYETKLNEVVEAVHDNQRLHMSLQRLAVNLLGADSLDDVLAIIDDELRHKLGTDFIAFRLTTEAHVPADTSQAQQTYVAADDALLVRFASLIEKKRIQCGRLNDEQMQALFADAADEVKSAALIPVADAGITGFIALGSRDAQRYHPGMGTDFLSCLADLISAALRAQLPR